jgi:hypothetical protein
MAAQAPPLVGAQQQQQELQEDDEDRESDDEVNTDPQYTLVFNHVMQGKEDRYDARVRNYVKNVFIQSRVDDNIRMQHTGQEDPERRQLTNQMKDKLKKTSV